MVDRILLGAREGNHGIWVSKPGFDVKSTGLANMLLSSERGALQAIHAASVALSSWTSTATVMMPSVPYIPLVQMTVTPSYQTWVDSRGVRFHYTFSGRYRKLTDTSLEIGISSGTGNTGVSGPYTVAFIIFARPVDG